jgi:ethanolamine utilization protein EutQ (cupin superfamily)
VDGSTDIGMNFVLTIFGVVFLGTPLVYKYTYHEMKIIVDGSFDISDETGKKVHATKGDVFYFPKGSKITFETDDFGLGFFVGQRKEGGA